MAFERNEILAAHYQDTYELTYRFWAQRNRLFVSLLVLIGLAIVLTYRPNDANPIFIDFVAKCLAVSDTGHMSELQHSFPFAILHDVLLMLIFFLTVNLFHRSLYVLRNFAYLGALERELRIALEIEPHDLAFSREGDFYWKDRPQMLATNKYVYVLLLGVLLIGFLGGRMYQDFHASNWLLLTGDLIVGLPIALYYGGYAWYTLKLDSSRIITQAHTEMSPGAS